MLVHASCDAGMREHGALSRVAVGWGENTVGGERALRPQSWLHASSRAGQVSVLRRKEAPMGRDSGWLALEALTVAVEAAAVLPRAADEAAQRATAAVVASAAAAFGDVALVAEGYAEAPSSTDVPSLLDVTNTDEATLQALDWVFIGAKPARGTLYGRARSAARAGGICCRCHAFARS